MKLQQLIEQQGFTPGAKLAKKIGVSRQSLYNWCSGGAIPGLGWVMRLSKVLGVSEKIVWESLFESSRRKRKTADRV